MTAPLRTRPLQPFFAAVYAISANAPPIVTQDEVTTMSPLGLWFWFVGGCHAHGSGAVF